MATTAGSGEGGCPLSLRVEPGGAEVLCRPEVIVVAGYADRDRGAALAHLDELESKASSPPVVVPCFYAVPARLLSQERLLVTTSAATSGEIVVALVVDGDETLVVAASDHTDRPAERLDVALCTRLCPKMIGSSAWRLDDVVARWNTLRLRSWIDAAGESATGPAADEAAVDDLRRHQDDKLGLDQDGDLCLYQEGELAALLPPNELLAAIPWRARPSSFVVLCGTVPTIGDPRPNRSFRGELVDPTSSRHLELEYRITLCDPLEPPTPATPMAPIAAAVAAAAPMAAAAAPMAAGAAPTMAARLQERLSPGAARIAFSAHELSVTLDERRVQQLGERLERLEANWRR